jgi:3-oxoacyl-[acyl-carrier-protein] synthase II
MKRRVVITGLGPVTPIGIGTDGFWEALVSGKSGARRIEFPGFQMEQYASKIACPVEGFSLLNFVKQSRDLKYLGRTSQFALAGAWLALRDAGYELEPQEGKRNRGEYLIKDVDPTEVGTIIGVGVENMDLCEKYHQRLLEDRGPIRISPFALPHIQIGSVPANISKKFRVKGATMNVSTACASGTHAIIEAFKQILVGEEKVMVTGGADACITPYVFGGFDAMGAMSKRNDEPERASRPFDKHRDGFVLGEGAGIVILEELTHALDRGAHIYCEMTGFGCTSDAYHIAAPDPTGEMQAKAMRDALKRAMVRPEEIDYINAHGTSTPLNDSTETLAIKKALGTHAYRIPISSTKSMTGHLMGGAGGIEIIATALMIQKGIIHATINLENQGDGCDLDYVAGHPIQREVRMAVKNSFAFGGQNAAVVLRRCDS